MLKCSLGGGTERVEMEHRMTQCVFMSVQTDG